MSKRSIGIIVIGCLVGLWAYTALGQEKPVEPTFTKEQSLQLENYELRAQTIQTQIALLQSAGQQNAQAREAYLQQVEKEHPGWLLSRQTLKWERAPVPAAPKK